jgi:cyclophilin family peptidyl-prolyl cis-trans isomerase
MTPVHRATPGRRTLRLAALVATAALALAACSSAATPAPTLPAIVPPTPTPVPTPTPTPDPNAPATPDLASCPKSWDQIPPLKAGETRTVTIQTELGNIVTEVSGDLAPMAAGNFVALAECGFYDGVVFHRTVPGFVIQAGDGEFARAPIENPQHMGVGGPGYQFDDEPVVGEYVRGTLAMANAGPDTNGSQFFIVLDDLTGKLDKNYTIFGRVTEGMDVVDTIAAAPQSGPPNNVPDDPVVMTKVTVSQ